MATNSQNILTTISNIYAELAAGPTKPSYSINGQSVSWNEYYSAQLDRVDKLRQQLPMADGPWEITS